MATASGRFALRLSSLSVERAVVRVHDLLLVGRQLELARNHFRLVGGEHVLVVREHFLPVRLLLRRGVGLLLALLVHAPGPLLLAAPAGPLPAPGLGLLVPLHPLRASPLHPLLLLLLLLHLLFLLLLPLAATAAARVQRRQRLLDFSTGPRQGLVLRLALAELCLDGRPIGLREARRVNLRLANAAVQHVAQVNDLILPPHEPAEGPLVARVARNQQEEEQHDGRRHGVHL